MPEEYQKLGIDFRKDIDQFYRSSTLIEMEFSQETIIGFLTGTLGTLVFKWIQEYFHKRLEFKRELKKRIYDKKLDAAENSVRSMFQNVQSSKILINAISTLIEKEMDSEIFEQIWEKYSKVIDEGETNLLSTTASLYFQLDDPDLWSDEDQQKLFDVYSKIKILGEEFQFYEAELAKLPLGDEFDRLEQYVDNELRGNAEKELILLKGLLQKVSKAQLVTIGKIKKEIKDSFQ